MTEKLPNFKEWHSLYEAVKLWYKEGNGMKHNMYIVMRVFIGMILVLMVLPHFSLYAQEPDEEVNSPPMTLIVNPIPSVTHGPISGEVTDTSVVLWARGNSHLCLNNLARSSEDQLNAYNLLASPFRKSRDFLPSGATKISLLTPWYLKFSDKPTALRHFRTISRLFLKP